MERESELVKVTGGMSLCARLGQSAGGWRGWRAVWETGWAGWKMVVEQLHVPPLPSRGTSRRRGPASTGERAGCAHLLLRCSRVLVEHQPLHGLEPGFTCGIKSNDRALPLNHTQPGWKWKPLLSAAAKGSYKGEPKQLPKARSSLFPLLEW